MSAFDCTRHLNPQGFQRVVSQPRNPRPGAALGHTNKELHDDREHPSYYLASTGASGTSISPISTLD